MSQNTINPPENPLLAMTPPDVGVLLVHGMGEQARGDTLLGFGEPLYRWIDGWINQNSYPDARQSNVRLTDTSLLRPRLSDPDAPPYLRLEIAGSVDGERYTKTLLIAESWWAKDFTGVSFSQMLSWATAFAPWMFERYARRRWALIGQASEEYGWRRALLFGRWFSIYVLAIVASFLFQVLILGLMIVAVIPQLRGVAASLQGKIAGAFGDPYILATSPVRFDAMISQVQRDLDWLCKRECAQLAVVAHSQGSVVAHEAMREKYYPNARRFITFGNPFGKLHLAREGLPAWDRLFWKAVWRNLGIVVALLGMARPLVAPQPGATGFFALVRDWLGWLDGALPGTVGAAYLLFVAGAAVFLFGHIWSVPYVRELAASDLRLRGLGFAGGLDWRDFWASADPFPDGPILEPAWDRISSTEVHNRHSIISDHTLYWRNTEEFVSEVAYELVGLAGVPFDVTANDQATLTVAKKRRVARVDAVRWAGWLAIGAVVVSWVALWERGLARLAGWIGEVVSAALALLPGVGQDDPSEWFSYLTRFAREFGAIAVAAIVLLLFQAVVLPLWRRWDRRQADELFERRFAGLRRSRALPFLCLSTLAPLVALALLVWVRQGGLSLAVALVGVGLSIWLLWRHVGLLGATSTPEPVPPTES
ncbi:MAG: hypothetical protein M3R06_03815 [Chloroflexota bacterium]|nr:hypothetical protein [Chloroflexota bacterium]